MLQNVLSVALTEFGSSDITQGQANLTSLKSKQKAAMWNPNDTNINTVESKICGKPVTTSVSSATNTTTSLEKIYHCQ